MCQAEEKNLRFEMKMNEKQQSSNQREWAHFYEFCLAIIRFDDVLKQIGEIPDDYHSCTFFASRQMKRMRISIHFKWPDVKICVRFDETDRTEC